MCEKKLKESPLWNLVLMMGLVRVALRGSNHAGEHDEDSTNVPFWTVERFEWRWWKLLR